MTEDNGALMYCPGSHRLPVISVDQLGLWADTPTDDLGPEYKLYEDWVRALIRGCGLEERKLTCPKGSALIWASNLLHGGSPVLRADSTRFSQVTHYYFENCLYYTPIHSNRVAGELRLKSVFDISNRCDVPHTINGMELDLIPVNNRNHRIGKAGSMTGLSLTSPERDGTVQRVLEALQHQATALLADRKARPAERAQAMARLCEVALKAIAARDGC
jgi:hypothetical protein